MRTKGEVFMPIFKAQTAFANPATGFSLIVHHHLGLGDHIICNGLVHCIKKRMECSNIFLLTKPEYLQTITKLYEDFPDIQLVGLPEEYRLKEGEFSMTLSQVNSIPLLKVSFMQDRKTPFDLAFYRQLGIDFRNRWSEFRAPTNVPEAEAFFKKLVKADRYCLVANQSSVGEIEIDVRTALPIYYLRVGMTPNLLDWLVVIKNAAEIHCVDSAVFHLVDSLDLKNTKLFYHDIRKGLFHYLSDWISVDSFGAKIAPITAADPIV
jgi:hypothetical protein